MNEMFLMLIFYHQLFPLVREKIFRRGSRINNSDDRDSYSLDCFPRAGHNYDVKKKIAVRVSPFFFHETECRVLQEGVKSREKLYEKVGCRGTLTSYRDTT